MQIKYKKRTKNTNCD